MAMSGRRRGGGGRGPGQDSRRGQPSPSFPRGGGCCSGRVRDSSRGRRSSGSPPPYTSPPSHQVAPATQPPPPYAPQTSSSQQYQASSSSAAASVSREVSLKLTLEPQAETTDSPIVPSSSKAREMQKRPRCGGGGKPCTVRANHFFVDVADIDLHHYDVSITPEITSKKVNRAIIQRLIDLYQQSHLGGRLPAYDGRKSLYTAGALPFESNNFTVKLIDGDGSGSSSSSARKERQFKVTIKMASRPELHHLWEFLFRGQPECPQETIQALDVALRANPSRDYTVVGRSFFKPVLGEKGELGGGIEYWMGYYQSLRPTQRGLSLNIDLSARSFYQPILVTQFVAKHLRHANLNNPLSDQDRIKLKRALKGVKVILNHMEYAKTCKIVGISREPIKQLRFTLDDQGTNVSVVEYFRDKYNIVVRYASLPALQCGSEAKPVYYPMELCSIVEGQRYTKKLNDQQVRTLLTATCQHPTDRGGNIRKMVRVNNFKGNELVTKEFGIKVQEEVALVDARVLPAPMLKYHGSGQEQRVQPGSGKWSMTNMQMVNGGEVGSWSCVNFCLEFESKLQEFIKNLVEMCIRKGINFCRAPTIPFWSARPAMIDQILLDVYKESIERPLKLLIIILPYQTGSYGKIKRVCETELDIVSQCCQPRKAADAKVQYFENLALKVNVKVGGRYTVLVDSIQRNLPPVKPKEENTTIIFGADVTHPQPGEDSSSSIDAVVASMDWPEVTTYRGVVSAQPDREEIIRDLYKIVRDPKQGLVHDGMIRELLFAFHRNVKKKPTRIIFYRDGVSEGQFSQVLDSELDAIRKACSSIEEAFKPKVTFVVVQKRHRTRLFAAHPKQTDQSGNILPGTVVDSSICHPREFDFYLNSHAGIQGTSKPTHYHVLIDENSFTSDQLQKLTFDLCYTYALN
ncbi:hypothetical protein DITRI_Ditri14bG0050400 [Diplodiscus trichospermus]